MNDILASFFEKLGASKRQALYAYARICIGKNMSFDAPDEYGCADSVNQIALRALGRPIGGGASTNLMYASLRSSLRFLKVTVPQPGDIIISPTGYGGAGGIANGHVGIVCEGGKIMSNNSNTGLWEENYTLASWRDRYWLRGGYPVLFYRVIS